MTIVDKLIAKGLSVLAFSGGSFQVLGIKYPVKLAFAPSDLAPGRRYRLDAPLNQRSMMPASFEEDALVETLAALGGKS